MYARFCSGREGTAAALGQEQAGMVSPAATRKSDPVRAARQRRAEVEQEELVRAESPLGSPPVSPSFPVRL